MIYPKQKPSKIKIFIKWLCISLAVIALHVTLYFFYTWHKQKNTNNITEHQRDVSLHQNTSSLNYLTNKYNVTNLPSSSTNNYPVTTPINVSTINAIESKNIEQSIPTKSLADEEKINLIKNKGELIVQKDYSKTIRTNVNRTNRQWKQQNPNFRNSEYMNNDMYRPQPDMRLLDIDHSIDSKNMHYQHEYTPQETGLNDANQQLSEGVSSVKEINRRQIAKDRQREYQAYKQRKQQEYDSAEEELVNKPNLSDKQLPSEDSIEMIQSKEQPITDDEDSGSADSSNQELDTKDIEDIEDVNEAVTAEETESY